MEKDMYARRFNGNYIIKIIHAHLTVSMLEMNERQKNQQAHSFFTLCLQTGIGQKTPSKQMRMQTNHSALGPVCA